MSDIALTDEQLDADQVLCDAATEGPWEWVPEDKRRRGDKGAIVGSNDVDILWLGSESHNHYPPPEEGGLYDDADAAFIAAARTRWPTAIAEVRRLREVIVQYQNRIHNEFCGEPFEDCHDCASELRAALAEPTQESSQPGQVLDRQTGDTNTIQRG